MFFSSYILVFNIFTFSLNQWGASVTWLILPSSPLVFFLFAKKIYFWQKLTKLKAPVASFSRPRALVHCLVFCCLAIFLFCLPGTTIDDNAWRYTRRQPPIGGRGWGEGSAEGRGGGACLSEGPVTRSPDLLSPVLVRPACSAADTGLEAQVLTTTELALAESATVALHWSN